MFKKCSSTYSCSWELGTSWQFSKWISKFCFQWVLPFYFIKWNHYFSAIKRKFLESTSHFPSNFASTSMPSNITPLYFFLVQALHTFIKSSLLKCTFLGFSSAWVKSCQISHVSFETTSQFLFIFSIILQCHCLQLLCKF